MRRHRSDKQPADGVVHGSFVLPAKTQRKKVKAALKKMQEPQPVYRSGKGWWD